MGFELIFLGTGTSAGVPMIGCECEVCTSDDPRDQRDRPSVLIRYDDPDGGPVRTCLVDTTPDMRKQMIRHRINRIDGVFYTHAHADHVFGLDDLRRFNAVMKQPVDIYAEARVLETLKGMFPYIFQPENNVNKSFVPTLISHELGIGRSLDFFGAVWTPIRLLHGRLPIVGFRVDYCGRSLAYCTDVSSIPPESYPMLEGLDVLVIDGLRHRHHPTHLTIEQALAEIEQVKPKRAFLTHIAHDIRHAEVDPTLPDNVNLAYDGLAVQIGG
ncbi:MAG: MBL fold metallo-hydrolase [Phycisphaeraceae bacterium]